MSVAAIAKQVGCSRSTVGRYAPPGSFDRTRTKAATEAAVADAAARRAIHRQRYLDLVDELQERAASKYEHTAIGGVDAELRRWTTDRPPARETADLVRAAQIASMTELRLAEKDDDGGLKQAVSLLDNLVISLGRDESRG